MTALFSTTSLTGSESYTYLQSVMAMIVIIVWFLLTQACCSLYWCSGFLHHRTWSRHCTVPRDPTLHQLAAGPTPYLHTSRVCSTTCEWTQIHVQILLKSMTAVMTTNTDCFVHGSTAELVHAQLGVVFLSEFLILSLDPKLYLKKKKNPNSAIVYPHGRHPTLPAVQREMGEGGSDMDTDRNRESGGQENTRSVNERNQEVKNIICATFSSSSVLITSHSPSVLDWLRKTQIVMMRSESGSESQVAKCV